MNKTSNLGLIKNNFTTEEGRSKLVRESMNELMGAFNDESNMDIIDEAYGEMQSDVRDIKSEISLTNQSIIELQEVIDSKPVTITIISDEVPTDPCDVWLRPMGNITLGDVSYGNFQPINLSGVYLNDEPPLDKNMMWAKPISNIK